MSLLSRLQRTIIAVLAAIGVVAAALALLPYFVSEKETRAAVTRSLVAATGIDPRIEGNTRLTLLPRPAIRLDDVQLATDGRRGLRAQTLEATVRVLPLLLGRVEIATLTFERPKFSLEIATDGSIAVGLPLRAPASELPAPAGPELRIVDGTVEIRAAGRGTAETLSSVDASIAWSGAALTATGTFTWHAFPTAMTLSIADTAALQRGSRSGLRLRLEADALRIGFDGGLAFRNGIQAEGTLAADTKSLRTALALLNIPVPTRGGFGPFKLKAQAALAASALSLTALSVELDGNRSEGGLALKRDDERTVLQATLASDAADFTPYTRGLSLAADNGRDWSRDPLDVDSFSAFDLDLRYSAARLSIKKAELTRVAATATIKNGQFTVNVGDAQFYGGTLRGRASVGRPSGGVPEMKVEANLANFDLERGLGELAGIRRLDGRGSLTLALEGKGTHVHAITEELAGQVTLSAAQGSLNGINVEQVLRRLERKPLSGAPDFLSGRTPFDKLTARLRIVDGKARIEEAFVDSPLVRVQVAGETSIARRDYDLKGVASLVRSNAGANAAQSFELPFLVQGTWERPFLLPDPAALIQRSGAAAPLLDAARRQVRRERAAAERDESADPAAKPASDVRSNQ